MFAYTLTYKSVPHVPTYLAQLKEENPNILAIYDDGGSTLKIECSSEIYGAELAIIDAIVPDDMSSQEQALITTVKKEEAGRAALQTIVSEMNKDGDYFTSVDQGIAGSELLWPIEAFMKRGFFVFAYRKFWKTVPSTGTTIYDQATQDLMDSMIRDLCKEHSGVDDTTLDYIKTASTV